MIDHNCLCRQYNYKHVENHNKDLKRFQKVAREYETTFIDSKNVIATDKVKLLKTQK